MIVVVSQRLLQLRKWIKNRILHRVSDKDMFYCKIASFDRKKCGNIR